MRIILNGKEIAVSTTMLSYEQIILMTGLDGNKNATVTYRSPKNSTSARQGSLWAGEALALEDGMIINAMDTGGA